MRQVRRARFWIGAAALACACLACVPCARAATLGLRMADGRPGPSLPITRLEETSDEFYVPANALASALDLERFWRPETRKLVLKVKQRRIQVTVDTRLVLDGEDEVLLRVPVHYQQGSVMLPLEFLERVLAPALGGGARLDRQALVFALGSGESDVTALEYQTTPDGTEVRVQLARALRYSAQATSDEIVRVLLTGGRLDPLALAADRPAPLVRSVRAEQSDKEAALYLQVEPPLAGFEARTENGGRTLVIALRRGTVAPAPGKQQFVRPMVEMPAAGTAADSFDLIAIDAGHGGFDSGVKAGGVVEKDFTLAVATQLQPLLERDLGVRVLLVRSGDATLSVESRAEIANRAHADVFISLHCNAWFDAEAHGFEVLYTAPGASTSSVSALRSAEQGLTEFVPWNAACVPFAARSQRLAERVDAALGSAVGLSRRGLHVAPLEVLQGAAMPSIVLEMGFLTSPDDVGKLTAGDFATRVASALAAALREFKQDARSMAVIGAPAGTDQSQESRPQLPAGGPPSGGGEDHE